MRKFSSHHIKRSSSLNNYPEFHHIEKEIAQSKYILYMQNDWDQDGAVTVEPEVYHTAISFLRMYASELYLKEQVILAVPEINPCCDGSVDLSWRTNTARMLINIKRNKSGFIASFYGDLQNDELPVKGKVAVNSIAKHLLSWLVNLGT